MSGALFPVVEVPEFISENAKRGTHYKRSVRWDSAAGDFVRDGANRMVECDGIRNMVFQDCADREIPLPCISGFYRHRNGTCLG